MSCIITKNPNVEAFIARLLNEPSFKDGTLTLYADVPVKSIRYTQLFHISGSNPCSDGERYSNVVFDFVICHGDTIELCICFDEHEAQHKTMFKTYLHGLDYVRHHFLALEHADLEDLYANVMDKLHFFTDYQLTAYRYSLVPVKIPEELPALRSKRLLCEDAMSIFYTRDCGLFVRCTLTPEGTVMREPLTSAAMADTCFQALNWTAEENYCTTDLWKLLDMPLTEFFSMRKDSLHFMTQYLAGVKRLLGIPEDREPTTYGDCLQILYAIRNQIRSPKISAKKRDSLQAMQMAILSAFSQVISQWYIPFFQLPLLHYFTAAANLAGCYYPIWLYRSQIYPHLCNRPKDCFAVSELVKACEPYIMHTQQPAASFMLCELMLAPVCVPNAQ